MVGIDPDPWQANFLGSPSLRVLMNCSRQSGKSTTAAIRALHEALVQPGALVLILAPSERQAQELFAKVARFYRQLGHAPTPESDRKTGVALANGSRIEALPGSSERTVRGYSGVSLLIVDEAARVLDDLYFAVRPMLAVSGGALMMLSTPYGKRGVFYEEWTNGGPSWERYEVPATECPRIPPAFLAEERKALPDWVFRQEYLCSFEDTEDAVFTTEMVDGAVSADVRPLFGEWTA
jgi:phage FluMu gp28-like protein